jgi:hypothetical protein
MRNVDISSAFVAISLGDPFRGVMNLVKTVELLPGV